MLNSNPYNPDVLTCLANLSSDEVFTPPKLANEILDQLPEELWSDPDAKFLDPFCKSGVFLREIAKRLLTGLEAKIPDQQARINHIFKNQLYGIAITELTALLCRRSVYCSKTANGKYSVCDQFDDVAGNIRFERVEHTWENGKCIYCGASQDALGRGEEYERHAYEFIHTEKPEEIFNMQFDVIVGNPPYQLNDGGGTGSSARPIYNLFVEQAKKLKPRYLTMIIPSRWFSGGKGLDRFRAEMSGDRRIKRIVDFADSRDVFPGVDIAGGALYFLWDRDTEGRCLVDTIFKGKKYSEERELNEFKYLIRYAVSARVIRKVMNCNPQWASSIVSSRMPFGLDSKARPSKKGDLTLIWQSGEGPCDRKVISKGHIYVDSWKVMFSKTTSDHAGQPDHAGTRRIFSKIEILPPGYVCNETYLIFGPFDNERQAKNAKEFLKTKFCRFLVGSVLMTQNIKKDMFSYVPLLDFSKKWNDEDCYVKFNITKDEVAFIEETIRAME